MGARRTKSTKTGVERRDQFAGASNKIYLTWVVGIIIGALGLKPTSINAAGLSLSIEKPEIIQGIVFLVCLFETYLLLVRLLLANPFTLRDAIRNRIWLALPKGRRSFRGSTLDDLKRMRRRVRNNLRVWIWLNVFVMLAPAAFIVFLNHEVVGVAIKAISGIKS